MTPQKSPKNDTKLLLSVAGLVVVGAAGIALLAGLTADRDNTTRGGRGPAKRPIAQKTVKTLPAQRATVLSELEHVEPAAELASYDKVEVPATAAESPLDDAVEPEFRIDPEENFLARALESYDARDFGRAVAYLRAEVDARPERAWTQYLLGLSLWKDSQPDEAVAAMERAAVLDPVSIKTLVNLSRIQNDRGDYEAALEAAQAALAVDDDDATALFLQGRSLWNLSRPVEAVAALEQSVAVNPDNGYVHNLLGLIQIDRGRPDEALPNLVRAAELEPAVRYIQNNLGMALELSGKPAEALVAYRRAVEIDPGHGKALVNLARLELVVPPTADEEPGAAPAEAVAGLRPPETQVAEPDDAPQPGPVVADGASR